jgi:hypothetical protein
MAKYSLKTKMGEILKSPEAIAAMKACDPTFDETNKQLKMVKGLTLEALYKFPQSGKSPEDAAKIDAALQALG